ncbi:hypothetical protein OTU49_011735, partial [Cherax quadricarinatus]
EDGTPGVMAVCHHYGKFPQINLILRVAQLPVYCWTGGHLDRHSYPLRRNSSVSFNTKIVPHPKHQSLIICEFSASWKTQFSVLPKFARTMENNFDSERENVSEENENILARKQKRERETDSASDTGMTPPPKKSLQESSNVCQQPEEEMASPSVSLNAKHVQEDRIGGSANGDNDLGTMGRSQHKELEPSELGHTVLEDNEHISNKNISKQELTNKSTLDSCSPASVRKYFNKGAFGMQGSNLSLNKSLSLDSLDQDVSLTESLDQDVSLAESGNFSSGIFETECESLSSSQVFPDDDLEKFEESATPIDSGKVLDKIEESVPPCKKSKNKQSKDEKKKKKKQKKAVENADGDANKTLRPNFFLGIQITNADIHQAIVKVQEEMLAYDKSLMRSFIDAATSHLTLLVAYIDTDEALQIAQSALDECGTKLMDVMTEKPVRLTFSGVSHFSNQRTPRKIDPASYKQHVELHLGYQTVTGLQLLSMNKPKDDKRYFYCSKNIKFDVEYEENMNHSQCCFPRRPMLQKQPPKQQRSMSTSSEASPDSSHNWLLPTIGVMTVLAAIVAVSLMARLRGKP